MKKILILLVLLIGCFAIFNGTITVLALDGETDKPFVVYTESGEYLFEKSDVQLNDNYINKNFEMFEIYEIDKENKTAKAKFVKNLKKPNVNINKIAKLSEIPNKKICLYLTHNDESYVPTDGYDSIYGAGGVHDVAKALKESLENMGISVQIDETLHIPHDTSAYSRSGVTAKNLLNNYSPDAMFDVHRDGVARKYYATEVNGEERSKVRIVVGQANPKKEQNLEFAMYLMSVAEEKYPWLFSDIYFASGHYNQALSNKVLLFEMGTYLIEKDLVLKSTDPLADVINTALYNTTVDTGNGDITIGGSEDEDNPTVNDHLDDLQDNNNKIATTSIIITVIIIVGLSAVIIVASIKHIKKK